MTSTVLQKLVERKKTLGDIGAISFLIEMEQKRLRKLNTSHGDEGNSDSGFEGARGGQPIADFCRKETPSISDIKEFARLDSTGRSRSNDLLVKASLVAEEYGHEKALSFALSEVDEKDYNEINLLYANASEADHDWLSYLNAYLRYQKVSSIALAKGESDRFYRLTSKPACYVHSGPKVSILMPAYNAEKTLEFSVKSVLKQSWKNLELIIVDDCSSDGTWRLMKTLSHKDDRIKILRNPVNVGPYVSKNRALQLSSGEYITGHDADDWAHPERIERQVLYMLNNNSPLGVGYMIRLTENGLFSYLGKRTSFSPDGAMRKALISTVFEASFFKGKLGSWDCVRFGADSEILARAEKVLGRNATEIPFCGMLCLDLESNLTNHSDFGIDKKKGISKPRADYRDAWRDWHKSADVDELYLAFGSGRSKFPVPQKAAVPEEVLSKVGFGF